LISRPTAVERAQGVEAITTLHELKLLRGKATAVEPNVIALALAWRRGDLLRGRAAFLRRRRRASA